MNDTNTLRYIRYSRKSSEAKEKQIASIGDQNSECDEHAAKLGLHVVARMQEEHSAFKPNKREKFTAMVEAIKSGTANAILTWKPDRICRNPLEGGIVLQLLQDGIIKEIRTPLGDVYTPDSDHLILQIHFGMANQYSRLLSQNVKRGLNRKAKDRHEYPRRALLGYEGFGERGQRNIRPHPLEAPLILKAFKLAATGVYSLEHIAEELHEAGFRSKTGKKMSKSYLYTILTCPTYYGYFYQNGELFEGNYEAVISKGLFDLVQEKLKDRSRPKNIVWAREYTKLFRCGTCGCAITTTIKRKFVKGINDYRCYLYHHCTKRRGNCDEQQLSDLELKKIVLDLVDSISIDQETWRLGLELVREKHAGEVDKNKHEEMDSYRTMVLMAGSGVNPSNKDRGSKFRLLSKKIANLGETYPTDLVSYYDSWWRTFIDLPIKPDNASSVIQAERNRNINLLMQEKLNLTRKMDLSLDQSPDVYIKQLLNKGISVDKIRKAIQEGEKPLW